MPVHLYIDCVQLTKIITKWSHEEKISENRKKLYWFHPKYLRILDISECDQKICKSELFIPKIYEIHVECFQ